MPSDKDMPQWWYDNFGNRVRVMAVVEGYVLARNPKKAPFVNSMADFKNRFKEGMKP